MTRRKKMTSKEGEYKDLLKPIFVKGKRVYKKPELSTIRTKVQEELKTLHRSIKRFTNPHSYPVGLEKGLYNLKTDLILKLREINE